MLLTYRQLLFCRADDGARCRREARRLRPVAAVEMLEQSMKLELDLRMEASAIAEMAENTKDDPGFRLPTVDWPRTAKRVLTTEWIDGTPMADVAALRAQGFDLMALGDTVIQSFLRHAIRDGFFHADMHQGNLLVDPSRQARGRRFRHHGQACREGTACSSPKSSMASSPGTTCGWPRCISMRAMCRATRTSTDFAQALRAIGEPIMGLPADQISMARLLTQLFEVTEQFDMETQPQLLLLQKTMVVVEGVARTLNPNLNMWKTAEPVVRQLDRAQARAHRQAGRGACERARFLAAWPPCCLT